MAPKDVAGVFSRPFIVGHFLPAFFALGAGALLTTKSALPAGLSGQSFGIQLLIIGAAALPLGLLLSNVHSHVVRTFSGEAVERRVIEDDLAAADGDPAGDGRALHGWVAGAWRAVTGRLLDRHRRRVKRQQESWSRAKKSSWQPAHWERFDEEFPLEQADVLPTRLGNAIRAYESYADSRYGLAGATVWPRIELLLSGDERALIADARTEVSFFLNVAVCSLLVAAWVAIEAMFLPAGQLWWLVPDAVAAVLLFTVCRLGAVTATFRAGAPIRAAVDLHRLELYDRLGVRRPTGPVDERHVAAAVNALLVRRQALPEPVRATGKEAAGGEEGR